MRNVNHTANGATFRCLEHLKETFLDVNLIHVGEEYCRPSHICSDVRDEYIIHFIFSGKGFFSAKSNSVHHLSAGHMFLIQPGKPVTYGSDAFDPWHYAWVGFNGIKADTILKQCGFSTRKQTLPFSHEPEAIMECIDHILDCETLTYANELRRKAWLFALFAYLIDDHKRLTPESEKSQNYSTNIYVNLAIEHIKQYYKDGIHVSDIADHLGISRAYLNYAFQKELCVSIQKFLIDFRMHKAANLLVSTTDTIKEISQAVGYEDQLTFSKAFKRKFGTSPKNYRTQKVTSIHYNEKQPDDKDAGSAD